MDVPRRLVQSFFIPALLALTIVCGAAGCAAWTDDFSPSDMLPSKETWDKLSPSNIWYNMSSNRLNRLNEGPGLSSDAYFSVPDPMSADGTDSRDDAWQQTPAKPGTPGQHGEFSSSPIGARPY